MRERLLKENWQFIPFVPLAWLYKGVIGLRNYGYDKGYLKSERITPFVISVGNITVGGTGKTPTTAYIANQLTEHGWRVVIVARGYQRKNQGTCIVSDGQGSLANFENAGDEPLLLAQSCPRVPVIVSASKTEAAQLAAQKFCPAVIIIDDGFQHRRLARNMDIVMTPAYLFCKQSWALPAGPLRETTTSLKRANIVLINDLKDYSSDTQKNILLKSQQQTAAKVLPVDFHAREFINMATGKKSPMNRLAGRNFFLVSGIAFPKRFYKMVEACGACIVAHHYYSDHHSYSPADATFILESFQTSDADSIVTTSKDAIKLKLFKVLELLPIYILEIGLVAPEQLLSTIIGALEEQETKKRSLH